MKYKIGIFGSSDKVNSQETVKSRAKQLGEILGQLSKEVIIVTGGSTGLPYMAALEAFKAGTEVWGFSPVTNMEEQKVFAPEADNSIYTKLQFVSKDLPFVNNQRMCMKYRNVLSTAECDAGIIMSGRWGSLNEFTNLIDMQKVVGVLTGTGGIADELIALSQKISKEGQGKVLFNNDPKKLVEEILKNLKSTKRL